MAGGPVAGPVEGDAVSGHDERDDYDDEPLQGELAPEHVVRGPAGAMVVIAWVQVFCTVLGFAFGIVLVGTGPRDGPADWRDLVRDRGVHNLVAICVAGVAVNLVILRGATWMDQYRRYPWAVAAAVLTALAVPCIGFALLTIPFAAWALVVLLRRDVRARFEAVARGTMNAVPPEVPDARRTDAA